MFFSNRMRFFCQQMSFLVSINFYGSNTIDLKKIRFICTTLMPSENFIVPDYIEYVSILVSSNISIDTFFNSYSH